MNINNMLSTLIFSYSVNEDSDKTLSTRLLALAGIKEVILSPEEQTIYLRVNKGLYQKGSAEELIHPQ
jgi:hypothetical protein